MAVYILSYMQLNQNGYYKCMHVRQGFQSTCHVYINELLIEEMMHKFSNMKLLKSSLELLIRSSIHYHVKITMQWNSNQLHIYMLLNPE